MNIGIDFDNTITDNPGLFRELTAGLSKNNHIYIISSYEKAEETLIEEISSEKTRMLNEWGINFKELYLAPEPVPESKAAYCKKKNIVLMIDDLQENLSKIMEISTDTVCMRYLST